jgi:hypothetical protein
MGSVAMIVGRSPQVRCNDLGHSRPFIAIRPADDCGSLHIMDGVLRIAVPEVILDEPQIVAAIVEVEAA